MQSDGATGRRGVDVPEGMSTGVTGRLGDWAAGKAQDSGMRTEKLAPGARHLLPGAQDPAHGTVPLQELLQRIGGLHLFRGVLEDEVGKGFVGLLRGLATENPRADRSSILAAYAHLFSLLAGEAELSTSPLVGDAWQNHLLDRLLADENPFSRKAEREPLEAMGPSLVEAARSDLRLLQQLFQLDGETLFPVVMARLGEGPAPLAPWGALRPVSPRDGLPESVIPTIKLQLASASDWPSLLAELSRHYAVSGVGDFARFRAFRWVHRDGRPRLEGVAYPDRTRLEELVEYDVERALLLQNTEQFVEGFPANNALLYGDRGTGKSSTIKALLHRYGERGLRLVEVPKGLLGDFPRILATLRQRPERFILFVDDLSFDERETAYKELKAALEGSLEARPDNVVVYATSNRRHLVQERFSDRTGGDGEIRSQDTHQEKLSLADRFGITLVFSSPDQGRYLRIVESLALQRELEIDGGSLRARALQWAVHQGGFSGRTARQFVDHLAGEQGVARRRGS
ncbi:MAG: ATP-binding protein [Chloroflexota bacterium]